MAEPSAAGGPPIPETPETPAAQRGKLFRAFVGLVWMYGGRGIGLLWTLALIDRLGISQYGLYGMAFALTTIVAPAINNPYAVRAIRESEQRFLEERYHRYLVGLVILLAAQAFLPFNYIAWFGLTVAGGETVFKSYQSRADREGNPNLFWRQDTIRQTASVCLACIYLYAIPHPTLLGASVMYAVPYIAMVIPTGLLVRGHRPRLPGPPKIIGMLMGEMLGTAVYLQGDVLLLGWLTNSTIVGYYTIALLVASSIALIGQTGVATYNQHLRESGGDLSAAPPLRRTLTIAVGGGIVVFLIGLGLLASPAPTELAVAMMIMALYTGLRSIILVFQQILYVQRRDVVRLTAAIALVPFKLGLVAVLASMGAVGAAIATVVTDAVLLVVFTTALYRNSAPLNRKADP
jgi:O-antigen/teichoic acid export membrane protein